MTTPDCRNDCVEPLAFPKRPYNRPGLSRIDYRIGTYSDFREALLRKLDADPVLSGWTHRGADDPGIALLEGAAILGDILTFYQDLYANEAFLRTAQWRESIAELVRLLGYRLSPGTAGRGTFAFEVRGDKPVTIPKGFPLTAQVTGVDGQVDFETVEEVTAYPWLSSFNLFRPMYTPSISSSTKEFVLSANSPAVDIAAGDRLMVGDPTPAANPGRLVNAEIVVVESVRELHGQKVFRIKGALSRSGSVSTLGAFKLGRTFRHFGHSGPGITVKASGSTVTTKTLLFSRNLGTPTSSTSTTTTERTVDPGLAARDMPLEGEVDDVTAGMTFIIQAILNASSGTATKAYAFVRSVERVTPRSMTWNVVSGPATILRINVAMAISEGGTTYNKADIRTILLHEAVSPLLTLKAAPQETNATQGHDLYFVGTDAEVQALKGRTVLLVKEGQAPQKATVQSVQTLAASNAELRIPRRVTLDVSVPYADYPNVGPMVTVHGNLAEATQGKSEREVALGNGDNRQAFQTFRLPKAPLTYLHNAEATPPAEPELEVYVNDRLWKRVPSFYGCGPKDEVYIVREDPAGNSWVQFGDGKTGARLPSGVRNVVARYRTGVGAYGALREDTKVQAGGRVDRLGKILLPGEVSGGAEPESGEKARESAPGKVQGLDRLVSLRDFETEALAIPGVSRATAAWQLVDNVPSVVVTVLMDSGRDAEIEAVRETLSGYNKSRGPQRFPVIVHQGCRHYIYVDLAVAIDPAMRQEQVLRAVKEALGVVGDEGNGVDGSRGLLSVHRRRFGEREYATRIEGVAQNVQGVVWARVNGLGALAMPSGCAPDPLALELPTAPWPFQSVVPCDADRILALHVAHLQLSAVSATEQVS